MSSSSVSFYCRFCLCAEIKPNRALIDLRTETRIRDIIMERLGLFREVIVDLEDVGLGAYVCGGCYSMLEGCSVWVARVKRSQELLGKLYDSKSEVTLKVEECEDRGEDGGSWAAYSWSCRHCAADLPSMDALREHSKTTHATCFGFKCADCNVQPPNTFNDFVRHVRNHRHQLRNYCPYCDIKMEDDAHTELHQNEDRCETCGGVEYVMTPHVMLHEYESEDIPQNDQKPELLYCLVESDSQPELSDSYHRTSQAKLKSDSQPVIQNILPQIDNVEVENNSSKITKYDLKVEPMQTTIRNWSSYPLYCRFCNEKFHGRDALVRHCMKEHKTCFGIRCVDCSETQELNLQFIEHVRRHRPELKSLCPYCDCSIDDNDHSHIKQHENNDHLCVLCGTIYKLKKSLRAHQIDIQSPLIKPRLIKKLGPTTEQDLTCDICGLKLATLHNVRCHKQTHIARERTYACEECGKTFYTEVCLNKHKIVHDASAVETCKICNKTVRKFSIKMHVASHIEKRKFQCDSCSRSFRSKEGLKNHLASHLNVKSFKCSYCGKGFNYKNVLKVHTLQHTGARPYACDSCDKTFVNWSNCDKHMKRIHGTTLASHKQTPRGKIALKKDTMKPIKLLQNMEIEKWSQQVLERKPCGKKKKIVADVLVDT